MTRAVWLAGLGYGDEGKGTMIDALARFHDSKLVVRYNGGAQAGHNVVLPDGRHHCFSQFGAATFAGASTHLSRFMLVNPVTLLAEARHLSSIGIPDPFTAVTADAEALVTTPFHMAANRIRELERSGGRHGSCGMGIGETMSDFIHGGVVIRVADLQDPDKLHKLLKQQQEAKLAQVQKSYERASLMAAVHSAQPTNHLQTEMDLLTNPKTIDRVLTACAAFTDKVRIVDGAWLQKEFTKHEVVLFEGAQGVLLDQTFGFQPHTTWTDITFKNAATLTPSDVEVTRLGVIRSFMTRHGAGPLVTEATRPAWTEKDHNVTNTWQQSFRAGFLDLVAVQYAVEVLGGIDGLTMTHLDVPLEPWVDHYRPTVGDRDPDPELFQTAGTWVQKIKVSSTTNFARQERVTRELQRLKPVMGFEDLTDDRMLYAKSFAQDLGTKLVATSHGPTYDGKLFHLKP